jgi:hypothetical protein
VGSEKADHHDSGLILNYSNQAEVIRLDIENHTRPLLRMLAFGWATFTSCGVFHCALSAIDLQASYCDRATLIPIMAGPLFEVGLDDVGTGHNL